MMDPYVDDVLQILEDFELHKLQNLYQNTGFENTHIRNYLSSVIRWKTSNPNSGYFTILAPKSDYENGTFIGINQYYCYELVFSTLEETAKSLQNALIKTKRINWNQAIEIAAVTERLYPFVINALKSTPFKHELTYHCNLLYLPREIALDYEITMPDDVYISILKPEHGKIVNRNWSYRYSNSANYFATLIKINGGYGVFLKSNHQLVAWTLQDNMGMAALHTDSKFRNKGYAIIATKYLAKQLAKSGFTPVASILVENIPSLSMIAKLGFTIVGTTYFIANKEIESLRRLAIESET